MPPSEYEEVPDAPDMIRRISDGAFIPNDNRNRDWIAYMTWLSQDGNEPDPVS